MKCGALYPGSIHAPEAIYRGARILEKNLNRAKYAEGYYRQIIELYPESEAAERAAENLENANSAK